MATKHRRKSSDKGKSVPSPHFLVHSPKDNVGVIVVENLSAGTDMVGVITETEKTIKLVAKESIPIGHKVALKALKAGDTVITYGEDNDNRIADVGSEKTDDALN